MNKPDDVKNLYIKEDTLSTRINLHDKYSVNKYGWSNWVFDQYQMGENLNILEFGCGTSNIWVERQLPENTNVILTDISPLMIEKTKDKLCSINSFSFQVMDIQNVPFSDSTFDIVIANHMLYHVPNLAKALNEVKRILKDDGIFYTTTTGENHLRELQDIYRKYSDKVKFNYSTDISFTLENGEDLLKKYFSKIEKRRYIDSLEVTNVVDLMEYIVSYNEIPIDIYNEIYEHINNEIIKNKILKIKKDSGMFICK